MTCPHDPIRQAFSLNEPFVNEKEGRIIYDTSSDSVYDTSIVNGELAITFSWGLGVVASETSRKNRCLKTG
jgi:hypothetical protein